MSGEMDQAKGRLKKAAGDLTGDRKTKREGKVDEGAGKARARSTSSRESSPVGGAPSALGAGNDSPFLGDVVLRFVLGHSMQDLQEGRITRRYGP